jgi:hypothetical protein
MRRRWWVSKERCKGSVEGDFCPACLCKLDNWSVKNAECETCGVDVYRPLDLDEVKYELSESAQIEWGEGLREIF